MFRVQSLRWTGKGSGLVWSMPHVGVSPLQEVHFTCFFSQPLDTGGAVGGDDIEVGASPARLNAIAIPIDA
jgi:hypothetical protein